MENSPHGRDEMVFDLRFIQDLMHLLGKRLRFSAHSWQKLPLFIESHGLSVVKADALGRQKTAQLNGDANTSPRWLLSPDITKFFRGRSAEHR